MPERPGRPIRRTHGTWWGAVASERTHGERTFRCQVRLSAPLSRRLGPGGSQVSACSGVPWGTNNCGPSFDTFPTPRPTGQCRTVPPNAVCIALLPPGSGRCRIPPKAAETRYHSCTWGPRRQSRASPPRYCRACTRSRPSPPGTRQRPAAVPRSHTSRRKTAACRASPRDRPASGSRPAAPTPAARLAGHTSVTVVNGARDPFGLFRSRGETGAGQYPKSGYRSAAVW